MARVCVHQPPRSQDCEKLGGGLGTKQRIHLDAQVSETWRVKTRMLLRGIDEVGQLLDKIGQLLHEVGYLLYEVHLVTASEGVAGRLKFSCKV